MAASFQSSGGQWVKASSFPEQTVELPGAHVLVVVARILVASQAHQPLWGEHCLVLHLATPAVEQGNGEAQPRGLHREGLEREGPFRLSIGEDDTCAALEQGSCLLQRQVERGWGL